MSDEEPTEDQGIPMSKAARVIVCLFILLIAAIFACGMHFNLYAR
jgi:hypothetical protein